jgi:hypothetical protein
VTPPHDPPRPAAAEQLAEVTPIRPPTLGTLTADVATETRIVRDLAELVGQVLARTTEARDLAGAAKSEASQARGVAARALTAIERVEEDQAALRAEVRAVGFGVADIAAALITRDADDAKKDRQLAAAKGVVGTTGAGTIIYAAVEIARLVFGGGG